MKWCLIASVLFINAEFYVDTTYTKYVFKDELDCLRYALQNYIAITDSLITNHTIEIKDVKYRCEALNQV